MQLLSESGWMRVVSKFSSLTGLVLELGRVEQLEALLLEDCPKKPADTEGLSKCCLGPPQHQLHLSTHQGSQRPPSSKRKEAWSPPPDGRRARKIMYCESSPRPPHCWSINWICSHSGKMLTGTHASPVGTALSATLHAHLGSCLFPSHLFTNPPMLVFPSNCH